MATKAQRLLTQLMKAIYAGDVDATRALIDAGADVNGTAAYNGKPLATATMLRDESARNAVTALLLERGADPNDRGPYAHDTRPVFFAAYCGYDEVVRMLLDRGGFPRDEAGAPAQNGDGSTLLSQACSSGLQWLAERALAEGCRADDVDRHGSTALHYAAKLDRVVGRAGKHTAWFIHFLLDHGAPLEHPRPGDWGTALHWAVSQGDPAAVDALVDRGAQLEARSDRTQQTPLLQGASRGTVAAVRAALARGADVHAVDATGKTALHLAAARTVHPQHADADMIAVLIAAGLDADARDGDGNTPLALAVAALPTKGKRRAPVEPSQSAVLAALAARTDPAVVAGLKLPR